MSELYCATCGQRRTDATLEELRHEALNTPLTVYGLTVGGSAAAALYKVGYSSWQEVISDGDAVRKHYGIGPKTVERMYDEWDDFFQRYLEWQGYDVR